MGFLKVGSFLALEMPSIKSRYMSRPVTEKQILENLTSAVILLNGRFEVTYMNSSAEMLLEASLRRLLAEPIDQLFLGATEELELLQGLVQAGQRVSKREARLMTFKGNEIITDFTATKISPNNLLIEIQPRDRLARIEREEEMLNRHATAKVLVRGLAHEIKNPLGGIRGAAQLLDRELDNEELKEFTRIIVEETDRLRNLVDRLMGPYRKPNIERLNIHAVLEHVRSLIEVEDQGNIQMVRDYDPSLPEFDGDYEQLIQVVLNICRNAMQSLTEAGTESPTITMKTRAVRRVTLGTEQHRLVCKVDIIDNGPGIPKELLDSVFYPMVTGRAEGSGLGLSIAQSVINQHQGLIEVTSIPGETNFQILIPLEL